jgi:hypothetical protein
LDIENAFDTTWHLGLLYKLFKFKISTTVIKLINSILSQRVSVEDEMSTPRYIQAGMPQGSVLSPTLYSLCVNDTPRTPVVYLGLFADDTCVRHTAKKVMFSESCSEVSVLLRRGVNAGTGFSCKKNCGHEPQGAWSQDELIGGKPPVVK